MITSHRDERVTDLAGRKYTRTDHVGAALLLVTALAVAAFVLGLTVGLSS
tara:strand:- start:5900 stop:6049 length:150 start_codon:yes stop_codon:yes gene_type:complete